MNQLFSILFAILLLFNSLGYYGLFLGWKYQNNVEMLQKLDQATYSESDLVTIKIPISVPYATDSEDYQRVDGLFEHKGEFYRLVKQRLFRDTLHVVCMKDRELAYINQAWKDYVKTFTDNHSEKSNSKIPYTFIKDYLPRTFSIIHSADGWESEMTLQSDAISFVSDFYPSIVHPPERQVLS